MVRNLCVLKMTKIMAELPMRDSNMIIAYATVFPALEAVVSLKASQGETLTFEAVSVEFILTHVKYSLYNDFFRSLAPINPTLHLASWQAINCLHKLIKVMFKEGVI